MKAAIDNMNGHACGPIKLYFQKQVVGWIEAMGCWLTTTSSLFHISGPYSILPHVLQLPASFSHVYYEKFSCMAKFSGYSVYIILHIETEWKVQGALCGLTSRALLVLIGPLTQGHTYVFKAGLGNSDLQTKGGT